MRVTSHLVLWACGIAVAETQTTDSERRCLARHAAGRRTVAEIGVWHGVTTATLLRSMAPTGVLYAVDPFPKGRLGFSAQRLIARCEVSAVDDGRVRWIRSTGADAADVLGGRILGQVELLFIDGAHDYATVSEDWQGWLPLLAPTGVVALHDSASVESRGVSDDVIRFTRDVVLRNPEVELIEQVDTLTVVRVHNMRASITDELVGLVPRARNPHV